LLTGFLPAAFSSAAFLAFAFNSSGVISQFIPTTLRLCPLGIAGSGLMLKEMKVSTSAFGLTVA
jgi:hypothetical protein